MIKIFENLKPVPEEMEDLAQLIAQPNIEFVGQNFIQKWKDEDGGLEDPSNQCKKTNLNKMNLNSHMRMILFVSSLKMKSLWT